MKRRVGIARALVKDPKLLIVDDRPAIAWSIQVWKPIQPGLEEGSIELVYGFRTGISECLPGYSQRERALPMAANPIMAMSASVITCPQYKPPFSQFFFP